MKKTFLIYLLLILPALFLLSCSEESSELEALENLNIHQPGVLDSTSANFHGKFFDKQTKNMKFTDCQKCHGNNLSGGITEAKSCGSCHSLATIHIDLKGVQDTTSTNFHGRYLLQHSMRECGQCHGATFTGGTSSPSCVQCHKVISVHRADHSDTLTTSANFHGKYPLNNSFAECQTCHGKNFAGGISSPSCATCHKSIDVHKEGIVDTTSSNFHGKYAFKNGLADCSSCHGLDFKGGGQSPACTTCHAALSTHKEGIVDPNSPNFHGKYQLTNGFTDCQKCHGENFQGSVTSPSCANCHKSIDVHKTGIVDQNSANFHGKYKFKAGFADCTSCHGATFSGGTQSPSCATSSCHTTITIHKAGIIDQNSADFHGKNQFAKDFTACKTCHGENFEGGLNSPSCATCHASISVHKTGITDQNSANFHGKFLKGDGWNISKCSSCHGSTFAGGTQSPSCKTSGCHTSSQGPAACNTCHGDFNDPSKISPPKDLDGNVSSTSPGVGAHSKHLSAFANGVSFSCTECHTVPADVYDAGHLGSDGKAELNFGSFTNKFGGTTYDFGTNKCSNTYCHGNFEFPKSQVYKNFYTADKMVGNNRSPVWTSSNGSETKCFSCHGKSDTDPSPVGHISYLDAAQTQPITIDKCVLCHSTVVDASGTIIDKTKHINGKVNVFSVRFRK